jgi:hypothetical protein
VHWQGGLATEAMEAVAVARSRLSDLDSDARHVGQQQQQERREDQAAGLGVDRRPGGPGWRRETQAAAAGWPGQVRGPARTQAQARRRAGRRLAAEFRVDGKLRGLLDRERSK